MEKKKKDSLKNPKLATGRLLGIQMQKEAKSNPKQLSCKKKSVALKKAMVKKDVKSKMARSRNGCDGRFMVKILITTILCQPLTYHFYH